jgi:hypothetical protein
LFTTSIERAYKYRITDIATIERIAALNMTQGASALPSAEVDENFRQRDTYQEGRLTDAPDLSIYEEHIPEEDDD